MNCPTVRQARRAGQRRAGSFNRPRVIGRGVSQRPLQATLRVLRKDGFIRLPPRDGIVSVFFFEDAVVTQFRPLARLLPAAIFALVAAGSLAAQAQHAHVHGEAFADVAVDGGTVEIVLRATAYDLVGFERAASSPEEEAKLLNARRLLLDHSQLWRFSVGSQCVAQGPVVEVPGSAAAHDHNHNHNHSEDKSAHADWTARYRFVCANPEALRNVDAGAFDAFPSLEKVTVQLLDSDGARALTLFPASRRLAVRP